MLKAITASLLMEQVLAPHITLKVKEKVKKMKRELFQLAVLKNRVQS